MALAMGMPRFEVHVRRLMPGEKGGHLLDDALDAVESKLIEQCRTAGIPHLDCSLAGCSTCCTPHITTTRKKKHEHQHTRITTNQQHSINNHKNNPQTNKANKKKHPHCFMPAKSG